MAKKKLSSVRNSPYSAKIGKSARKGKKIKQPPVRDRPTYDTSPRTITSIRRGTDATVIQYTTVDGYPQTEIVPHEQQC